MSIFLAESGRTMYTEEMTSRGFWEQEFRKATYRAGKQIFIKQNRVHLSAGLAQQSVNPLCLLLTTLISVVARSASV